MSTFVRDLELSVSFRLCWDIALVVNRLWHQILIGTITAIEEIEEMTMWSTRTRGIYNEYFIDIPVFDILFLYLPSLICPCNYLAFLHKTIPIAICMTPPA